jgi:quinol monooxygenase YgiN
MTMRKLLLSFLALGTLAIPAAAQQPQHGLKTGYIAFTYTGEVLPGQMDNFKQVAAKVIAGVAEKEPGTLMYEWSMRSDQKTFDAVELYQNSDAVMAHLKHVGSEFGKDLGQVQKELSLIVYGSPNEAAKQALAGLNPVYETPIVGFIR